MKRYEGKRQDRGAIDIEELYTVLKTDTPEGRMLFNSVVRFAGNIKGIRVFWNVQWHQLEVYVRALNTLTIFMTFSTADNHWESFYQYMPRFAV